GISEGMSCTELDGEMCDNCLATTSGVSARKRRLEEDEEGVRQRKRVTIYKERERQLQQVEMDRGSRLEEMIERHEWLQDKCAVCWLVHDTIEREHVTKECCLTIILPQERPWFLKICVQKSGLGSQQNFL